MKIFVLSDTHGKLNRVRDVWQKLTDVDLIAHAGDYYRDAKALEEAFHVPVVAVRGNCDGGGRREFEIIETEYGNLLLTHGHGLSVAYSLDNLRYLAQENDCRAVIFGHTHEALVMEEDGMYFINPGSLSLPRDNSGGSYGIIRTTEDRLDASIVYYDTLFRNNKKSGNSGFIKSILNYSDRL
ncbi:MAG: metallophosphoesterase [Firmicutes bacterium]|nr:metallophosphoesterase [Bacillota bacterium]